MADLGWRFDVNRVAIFSETSVRSAVGFRKHDKNRMGTFNSKFPNSIWNPSTEDGISDFIGLTRLTVLKRILSRRLCYVSSLAMKLELKSISKLNGVFATKARCVTWCLQSEWPPVPFL